MQVRFRQLCYTHALKGALQKVKGWQAAGLSDKLYFKPLLEKYFSLALVPEQQRFKKFTIYGLQKVGDLPVLIRITDAGLTADGRPGNIFAHFLVPFEVDLPKFYACDICAVFLEGFPQNVWLNRSADIENPDLPDLTLSFEGQLQKSEISAAFNYLENNVKAFSGEELFPKLLWAAEQSLQAGEKKYLLVHPGTSSSIAAGIHLLRTLWSMLYPSQRKQATFWFGREEARMPGVPWIILSKETPKLMTAQTATRSVFGFDVQHGLRSPDDALQSYLEWNTISPGDVHQLLTEREKKGFHKKLISYFAYSGTDPGKIKDLIEFIQKAEKKAASKYKNSKDILRVIRRGASQAGEEERFLSFKSLIHISCELLMENQKTEANSYVNAAFKLLDPLFTDRFLLRAASILKDSLLKLANKYSQASREHIQIYLFYADVLFDHLLTLPNNLNRSKNALSFEDLTEELFVKSFSDQNARTAFSRLLYLYIIHPSEKNNIRRFAQRLDQTSVALKPSGLEEMAQTWYLQLIRACKHIPYEPEMQELCRLYQSAPAAFEQILLLKLFAKLEEEKEINNLIILYRAEKAAGRLPAPNNPVNDAYFDCLHAYEDFPLSVKPVESLINEFVEQEQTGLIGEEIIGRLTSSRFSRFTHYKTEKYPGFKKRQGSVFFPLKTRYAEEELIKYFERIFAEASSVTNMPKILQDLSQKRSKLECSLIKAAFYYLNKKRFPFIKLNYFCEDYKFLFKISDYGSVLQDDDEQIIEYRFFLIQESLAFFIQKILDQPTDAPASTQPSPEEKSEKSDSGKISQFANPGLQFDIQKNQQASEEQVKRLAALFYLPKLIPAFVGNQMDEEQIAFFRNRRLSASNICRLSAFFMPDKFEGKTADDFLQTFQIGKKQDRNTLKKESVDIPPAFHLLYGYYRYLDQNKSVTSELGTDAPKANLSEIVLEGVIRIALAENPKDLDHAWLAIKARFSDLFDYRKSNHKSENTVLLLRLLVQKATSYEYDRKTIIKEAHQKIFEAFGEALKEKGLEEKEGAHYWYYTRDIINCLYEIHERKSKVALDSKILQAAEHPDARPLNIYFFIRDLDLLEYQYEKENKTAVESIKKQVCLFIAQNYEQPPKISYDVKKKLIAEFSLEDFIAKNHKHLADWLKETPQKGVAFLIAFLYPSNNFSKKNLIKTIRKLHENPPKKMFWQRSSENQQYTEALEYHLSKDPYYKFIKSFAKKPRPIFEIDQIEKTLEIVILGDQNSYLEILAKEMIESGLPWEDIDLHHLMNIIYLIDPPKNKEKLNYLIQALQTILETRKVENSEVLCAIIRTVFRRILNKDLDPKADVNKIMQSLENSLEAFICLDLALTRNRELYDLYIAKSEQKDPKRKIEKAFEQKREKNFFLYTNSLTQILAENGPLQ